jgi:hypothetical protein
MLMKRSALFLGALALSSCLILVGCSMSTGGSGGQLSIGITTLPIGTVGTAYS